MIEIWASFNMAIVSHLFFVLQVAPMVFRVVLLSKCKPILEKHSCLPSSGSSKSILFSLEKKQNLNLLHRCVCVCSVSRSCPTLCRPVDCSLPGSSVCGIFQARILEWVGHFLLQGIFPTQGLNWHLLHWQADSLSLCYLGSPRYYIIRYVEFEFWMSVRLQLRC